MLGSFWGFLLSLVLPFGAASACVRQLGLGRYLVPTGITSVIWASFGVFSVI